MKANSTPDPASLRQRALGYLARREHSRAELSNKLETAGYAPDDIAVLLDKFEANNWLSDRRYAESYIADHHTSAGNQKLAHTLRQRGVSNEVITAALAARADSEITRARAVWQKKFGQPARDLAERARQYRFMLGRGFSPDCIRRVMDTTAEFS